MGLVASTLKSDLASAFNAMNNGDNKVFSQRVSAAVKKFAESGSIATVDAGGVSAGAFAGAGTGKITVDDSICEKIVYAACMRMNDMRSGGNEYLAAQLATGIDTMIAAGEVKTDVSGTVTPPSGSSFPLSGTATGKMTGVPAPMQAVFIATFNAMDGMLKGGGDDYMAQQVSAAVETYLKAGAVSTKGDGALSGSTGAGKMT